MNLSNNSNREKSVPNLHKPRKPQTPLLYKSLSLLLHSLQGEKVTVELKNDKEVSGIIETVGHGMDMKLLSNTITKTSSATNDTSFVSASADLHPEIDLSELFILGENILYVHIPTHIHITSHINEYVRNEEYRQSRKRKIVDIPQKKKMEGNSSMPTSSSSSSASNIDTIEKVIYMPIKNTLDDDHYDVEGDQQDGDSDVGDDDENESNFAAPFGSINR